MLPGIASAVQGKQSSHVTTMLGSYDTNLGEFHQVELQYMRYKSSIFQSHFIQNTHIHTHTHLDWPSEHQFLYFLLTVGDLQ